MTILERYVAKAVLSSFLMCLLVIAGLTGIIKWVDQLRLVGRGTYTLFDAGLYVLFMLPREIDNFFPMIVLLSTLIGMGLLASNSELIVMQSVGLSKFKIVGFTLKTAIPLMILAMALGEWVAPVAENLALNYQANKLGKGDLITSQQGIWARDGNSFVNIGSVASAIELDNVTEYKFNSDFRLKEVVFSKTAKFINGAWTLKDVVHIELLVDKIMKKDVKQERWTSSLTPDKLNVVSVYPDSLSIRGLMDYIGYLKDNNQNYDLYELSLWRKIMQPASIAIMILVAMSFIFGLLRSSTLGARIILGIVAGFAFHIANQLFGPMSLVYSLPLFLGATIPIIIFGLFAIYMINK